MEMIKPLVYRGAREIAEAVGIPWKEVNHYVSKKGLPAFKIGGNGNWVAFPADLRKWLLEERKRELGY